MESENVQDGFSLIWWCWFFPPTFNIMVGYSPTMRIDQARQARIEHKNTSKMWLNVADVAFEIICTIVFHCIAYSVPASIDIGESKSPNK